MKRITIKISIAVLMLTASSSLFARPADGVACRGTTPDYRSGVLKCFKNTTKTFRLGSMCPPINRPLNIIMNSRGRDSCSPAFVGNKVRSARTPPLPGYPPINQFRRVVSNNGVDTFIATTTRRNYKHPIGKRYLHRAEKGVICPARYTPSYSRSRLKCKRTTTRLASCDVGWRLEVRPNRNTTSRKDICKMVTPLGVVKGNYTIPKGTTGAAGNPTRFGWRLTSQNGRDKWVKVKYKYPKAAR